MCRRLSTRGRRRSLPEVQRGAPRGTVGRQGETPCNITIYPGKRNRIGEPGCSIEIEMSGLVDIEMSSFGAGSPTLEKKPVTERGDAKVEHARSGSTGGAA